MAQTEFPERARIDNANGHLVVQRNLDFLRDAVDQKPNVGVPVPLGANGSFLRIAGGAQVWQAGNIVDADISASAAIEGNKLGWHVSTTPPGSPVAGMLWIYPGSGFYWLFVYDNSEATYKWKCIGGAPMRAGRATDETFTEGATYVNAGSALAATFPRAGDYFCEHTCDAYISGQTAAGPIAAKLTISNGALEINDSTITQEWTSSGAGITLVSHGVNTGTIAGGTVTQQYIAGTALGGTAHVRWRNIAVWPIRVI